MFSKPETPLLCVPTSPAPVLQVRSTKTGSEEHVSIEQFVRDRCPSLARPYKPLWWLNSGHLQTIYSVLGDFSKIDLVRYDRTLLRVPDGGTIGLDFTPRRSELSLPEDTPIVVVLHGLTGGSYEPYVRSILAVACKPRSDGGLGYRAVVVNFRGCAGVSLTSPRMYSAGTTDDLATAILYVSQTFPKARLMGLGFSLGANVLTRYIALEGDSCPLVSGCVLGCPWDLVKNTVRLESTLMSKHIYSKAMANNVVAIIRRNVDALSAAGSSAISPYLPSLLSGRSFLLREVDEQAVRLVGGPSPPFPFETANDYYRWASTHDSLDMICIPFLALNAADDPVVQTTPTSVGSAQHVAIVLTGGGGHLGWFERAESSWHRVDRWVKKPVLEWLRAAEDLVVSPHTNTPISEMRDDGLIYQVNRPQVGYRVVQCGLEIDTERDSTLVAGL